MAKTTDLTVQEQRELLASPILQEIKKFEMQQRMAQMYTTSTIVPDTYRSNLGNCVIAIDMAMRMGTNPLMTMQNLYIVHGQPSWSTKFLIACVNKCGRFMPLEYEKVGDDAGKKSYKCRAFAYAADDVKKERPLYGAWITWDMVEKEGWSKKNGSKWLSMPEMMFMYRAAAFWSRTYAPEISMGFPTQEEVIDGAAMDVDFEDVTPATVPAPDPEQAASVDRAEPQAQPQEQQQPAKPETPSPQQAIQDAIKQKAEEVTKAQKPANNQSLFEQEPGA